MTKLEIQRASQEKAQKVLAVAKTGMSKAEIARLSGVSARTVGRVLAAKEHTQAA